jgi:hypothetical protein
MTAIRYFPVLVPLVFLAIAEPAGAADPNAVGIVMKVTGETDPALSPREELPANVKIKLGPGTELTFLHYPPRCDLVTVAGGTLRLSRTDFTTDGEVKNQQNRTCPRIYELSGTGGSWVARDMLRLSVAPELIFAGSRGSQVVEAAIYEKGQADRPLYRLDLADQRATPPRAASPLSPNGHYVLKITTSDEAQPVDYEFIAVASGNTDSLVVLHVD